jgi:hypothetical protein
LRADLLEFPERGSISPQAQGAAHGAGRRWYDQETGQPRRGFASGGGYVFSLFGRCHPVAPEALVLMAESNKGWRLEFADFCGHEPLFYRKMQHTRACPHSRWKTADAW